MPTLLKVELYLLFLIIKKIINSFKPMKHSFLFDLDAKYIVIFLFFAMLLAINLGYRFGVKKTKTDSDNSGILSSLLGLLALILAFTFGMSGSRYENRKASLIDESNCIGTAILRADTYPDSLKKAFKIDFSTYLDSRVAYFESDRDDAKINKALATSAVISQKLWTRAASYSKDKELFLPSNMMLPALNSMFDSASTANAAYNSNVPESIVYLLLIFSVIISFYIGYSSGFKKKIDKFYILGFCLLTSIVIYITLDLDRPRRGSINMHNEVFLFKDLKNSL